MFVMRGSANRKGTLPIISFHGVVRPYQPPPLPVTQTLFFLLCIYGSRDFTPPQAIVASLYSNHFFTLIFVAVIRAQSKHAAKLNPFLEEKKSNVKNGMQKKCLVLFMCVRRSLRCFSEAPSCLLGNLLNVAPNAFPYHQIKWPSFAQCIQLILSK